LPSQLEGWIGAVTKQVLIGADWFTKLKRHERGPANRGKATASMVASMPALWGDPYVYQDNDSTIPLRLRMRRLVGQSCIDIRCLRLLWLPNSSPLAVTQNVVTKPLSLSALNWRRGRQDCQRNYGKTTLAP